MVQHPSFTGKLVDYRVRRGMRRVLQQARFRASDAVTVNVVIRWRKGLPDHRDEPWFLITDLSNGFALRHTQVTRADRFDRLLLVLVLAYLLVTGLGLRALAWLGAGAWSSTDCGRPCSAVVAGRTVWHWFRLSPKTAIAVVLQTTISAAPNWG